MAYHHLLIDLDHTLLDSDASEAAAHDLTLRQAGVDDPGRHLATFRRINRSLWAEVEAGSRQPDEVRVERFTRLVTEIGLDADPSTMAHTFVTALGQHGELYPGVADVLDHLADCATLALVTNGIGQVQRTRIDRLGIDRHFDAIVISGEVGTAKPGARIFDLTFERLGRPPKDDVVMVGDSLTSDMAGGAGYGIATCWYNPHRRSPGPGQRITHQIVHLDELIGLVG